MRLGNARGHGGIFSMNIDKNTHFHALAMSVIQIMVLLTTKQRAIIVSPNKVTIFRHLKRTALSLSLSLSLSLP
jgi:transcription termination factor Rho